MRHQGRSDLHTYPVVRGTERAAYGAALPLTQAARAKGTAFLSSGLPAVQ
jgi:hypothetical protein